MQDGQRNTKSFFDESQITLVETDGRIRYLGPSWKQSTKILLRRQQIMGDMK